MNRKAIGIGLLALGIGYAIKHYMDSQSNSKGKKGKQTATDWLELITKGKKQLDGYLKQLDTKR